MSNKSIKIERPLEDVIDTEYRSYAMYTLENRAIPSVIDGLKPTSRKVLYAMLNEHKGAKTKIADLGSISKYNYHHGEGSAMGAAITLAASYSNNVPIFNQHGFFGTRLVPAAAAPRYIFATLNKDFYKYFTDFEVCDPHSDSDNPEPQTYLPLIPWVLVNGIEGIAVGFASKFMPHDPLEVTKACIAYLTGKKIPNLIPKFPQFNGTVTESDDPGAIGKYIVKGIIERTKRNTWRITEVPYGYDRESYLNVLIKMEEKKLIEDFDDVCSKTGFEFIVKLSTEADAICAKDPIGYFKLEKIVTENYSTLDETGKLKLFNNKSEIVKYFCDYRLKKVQEKINYDIEKLETEIKWLSVKAKFVSDVNSNKVVLKTKKKADWIIDLQDRYKCSENDANNLLNISVVDMTEDYIQNLKDRIEAKKLALSDVKSLVAKDVFISLLKAIK